MSVDYENDPRMTVVRRFIWQEVLRDTKDGLPGDEYYWLIAEALLRSIDSGEVVPLPTIGEIIMTDPKTETPPAP